MVETTKIFDDGVYGGENYTLSLKTNACYGVTGIVDGDNEDESYDIDAPSIELGPLNGGLFVSSGDNKISVRVPKQGELESDLKIRVKSRPLAYQVVYWQNHDSVDNVKYEGEGNTKLYTDFDDRQNGSGDADLERGVLTDTEETYQYLYHRSTIERGVDGAGFTDPTNKKFAGWLVNKRIKGDDDTLIEENVDFHSIPGACGSLVDENYLINLYAIYVDKDTYKVTVYFDSAVIPRDAQDEPIIDLVTNS